MTPKYSYQECVAASQKINWRVEDLIGGDKRLDFAKPFLPETLARVEPLKFLNGGERLALNHIRSHGYLYVFGQVEEIVQPFVANQARPDAADDGYRVRAFLQFAAEEAKHIQLFKRFRADFEKGFGCTCAVIGPPLGISRAVLAHHPLSVALVILQFEWMTQRHYVDSVKEDRDLDPQFKSLLKHHWMEEAQHAKLDTLMIEAMARDCGEEEIAQAIEGYVAICGLLDGGLTQQVAFDLEALTRASGREFTEAERDEFIAVQQQAARWTFLGSGMTHENFLATVESLRPGARAQVEEMAPAFC